MTATSILDLGLAGLAVALASATLWARQPSRMVMLFIAVGGVVALIWVRLHAPDVALAEAAIGAALTGGLMLRARVDIPAAPPGSEAPPSLRLPAAAFSLALSGGLSWALLSLDWGQRPGLQAAVAAHLGESGVTNPVTAVLLNFRGYDTLLEVAVLLIAVIAVWMLGPRVPEQAVLANDPLFLAMLRPLVPLLCVVSGYLLWLGAFAPGGAFQAGAVLCAALLLLLLTGSAQAPGRADSLWLRLALAAGLSMFVAVAAGVTWAGYTLLEYPKDAAKHLILLIEAALTISIAFTLVALFLGGRAPDERGAAP